MSTQKLPENTPVAGGGSAAVPAGTETAVMTVPCADLDRAMDDLRTLGFRLDEIGPADAPSYAVMVLDGTVLRLDHTAFVQGERQPFLRLSRDPSRFDIGADLATWLRGPAPVPEPTMQPSFTVSRVGGGADDGGWQTGRAGMRYRDLIPDRWGGSVIASHINIADSGPVPDYVHYHHVDFQLILCHRGWVRVVYQDQGDPFVLRPGDAVLQAPGIRHRVLESSSDCYVVEVTSPALHPTMLDHDLELPNRSAPGRRYGGQDFVHHHHDRAVPSPLPAAALTGRDLGLFAATDGRFHGYVIEPQTDDGSPAAAVTIDDLCRFHGRERRAFTLLFMLDGSATITDEGGMSVQLETDDSVAIPPHVATSVSFGPGFERALVLTGTPAGREPD